MSVDSIELWHKRARPNPTDKDFNVQLGCHFEEIAEMEDVLLWATNDAEDADALKMLRGTLTRVASGLKSGRIKASVHNRSDHRKEFLDSLADQIVTAVGVGHCAGMKMTEACIAVNSSNWSKYDVNGKPFFDENGKVAKGPNYHKPNLEGMY